MKVKRGFFFPLFCKISSLPPLSVSSLVWPVPGELVEVSSRISHQEPSPELVDFVLEVVRNETGLGCCVGKVPAESVMKLEAFWTIYGK